MQILALIMYNFGRWIEMYLKYMYAENINDCFSSMTNGL